MAPGPAGEGASRGGVVRPVDGEVDRLPEPDVALEETVPVVEDEQADARLRLDPEAALVDAVLVGKRLALGRRNICVFVELL